MEAVSQYKLTTIRILRRRIGRKEGEEEGKLANALEAKATNPELEQNAYTFEDSSWKLYLPEHLIFFLDF